MNGKLILIVGPSGSGKSSVLHGLKEKNPEYTYPLSATTRSMREGEKDGDIYHFYTKERFEKGDKQIEECNKRLINLEIAHSLLKGKLGAFILGLTFIVSLLVNGILWAYSHFLGKH